MGVMDVPLLRRAGWLVNYLTSMHNGRRNLYEVFGYTTNPTFDHRFAKYLRQDLAARVVDAPATALWTNPPLVSSNNDVWNTEWDNLVAQLNLFFSIERADKLAGIGRYSIIVIGFNDGLDLESPVNTRSLKQKSGQRILYLQPYSERSVKIVEYDQDSRSENFMKPSIYEIEPLQEFMIGFDTKQASKTPNSGGLFTKPDNGNSSTFRRSFRVHHSRVIHIAENCLENMIFGSPRMERVYNVLDDLLKVVGGTAETFWLAANRGLHVDVDKELDLDPGDAAGLADELEEYQHQLRRVIRTRGVTIKSLGSDTPDPRGAFEILIATLSGATGIPRRILTGSEAGQLASEQDRANWADRIEERRANFGNTVIIFQLIKKLTNASYLPSEESTQITVEWPSSFKMSPLENAQTSAQHARSATNFAKAIETMENLKRGEPGSKAQLDEEGNPIPGTEKAEVPGIEFDSELVTIEEARKMLGLDKPEVTFDSGNDVARVNNVKEASNIRHRRYQISVGTILKVGR